MMSAGTIQVDPSSMATSSRNTSYDAVADAPTIKIPRGNPETAAKYWDAVFSRNAHFDGVLYYGVKTTGIFCKPSCPSRRPKAENVRIFLRADDAQQAGFRACLRCKPLIAGAGRGEELRTMCAAIEKDLDGYLSMESLATNLKMSSDQLERRFKKLAGISAADYIRARRVAALKTELRVGNGVASATYAAGFGSSSRVYEKAAVHMGMTPLAYARGGARQQIVFTVFALAEGAARKDVLFNSAGLGYALVAKTERGFCRIDLGDSEDELVNRLHGEFSKAMITRDDDAFTSIQKIVVSLAKGKDPGATLADLPWDIRATAFQVRVWRELQKIASGETASYTDIARRVGRPRAVRAVATACASNELALIVPCHRVVRQSGALAGYRWGIERKRLLLEQERRMAESGSAKQAKAGATKC